ncbi:MAG: hypothetical protein LC137_10050 [Burkholderiales bacterium]|nr:hypothetical protein [Burkholderiales bacterium]
MQPTPAQQALLERIAAQRERLRAARHAAPDGIDPQAPLPARLAAFTRLHPLSTAVALGAVALAGPRRLVQWAGVVLPFLLRVYRR